MATPIIDTHHHFWRFEASAYAWIRPDMSVLRHDYLPRELDAALSGTAVGGVISVQARAAIEENAFLLEQADDLPRVRGVVGWAPLKDPRVGELLDRFGADPRFKGVREVTQGEPDEAFFTHPDFGRGLREVTRRGLTYDLLIYEDQLPAVRRLVDQHPAQRFVLDHIGKPAIRGNGLSERWRDEIRRLAERPHVACKWSGVVTEVRDPVWRLEQLRPYFETVWSAFGPERLMFGSDWPVCLLRATYDEWLETVHTLAADLAEDERARFFHRNAVHWYGLSDETPDAAGSRAES